MKAIYIMVIVAVVAVMNMAAMESAPLWRSYDLAEKLMLGDAYITVDPVDGTAALTRGQSHGIGIMIALVINGEVVSAFVGDLNTTEIYGYRPESEKVHRTSHFNTAQRLVINPDTPLSKQYVLLNCCPEKRFTAPFLELVTGNQDGGLFKSYEIGSGSIGILFARLWKDEVGAIALPPCNEKPWDLCPILGISNKLGFRYFTFDPSKNEFLPYDWKPSPEEQYRHHEIIVVHESKVAELQAWRRAA